MSKRKAAVNDIIYELDNEDIEISSEDEVKEAKINRLDTKETVIATEINDVENNSCVEIVNLDSTFDEDSEIAPSTKVPNGGKTSVQDSSHDLSNEANSPKQTDEVDSCKKNEVTTTIFNEDIVIDSPVNSDLGVVGCENRTPLVTVRFRDQKMAKSYKKKLKAFMLDLIKLHDQDSLQGSETETDLELDIWPEDLNEEDDQLDTQTQVEDNLFFVDTAPDTDVNVDIPRYSQNTTMICNAPVEEPPPRPVLRRGPTCFNCDGAHPLRDCPLPRNNMRIAENRKNMVARVGRYHVEDDQKYGHLVPGRISGQLRHALGLKRHELPMHIYRMRMLGYPPGWLDEARISHSGITMFDSTGSAILDPEEEEGEVCEPGCKDKFDIKKILDFPGFNVPASSRYQEESHLYNLPPMSEQDSKMAMLQMLAPNAMKAYKRKKLTFFPSSCTNSSSLGHAEMEIDSGDEVAEFPSVPPLPDEAPPPPPPPPPPCPPPLPPDEPPLPDSTQEGDKSGDDLEVIEVMKVNDIPVPEDELVTLDEDDNKSQLGSRSSPTLDDLEERKKRLLDALEGDITSIEDADLAEEDMKIENKEVIKDESVDTVNEKGLSEKTDIEDKTEHSESTSEGNSESILNDLTSDSDIDKAKTNETSSTQPDVAAKNETQKVKKQDSTSGSDSDVSRTPENRTGRVKTSLYGTPVMNIASSYTKLPTDEKFAKDICDVINFENLPNSTGKYKQISTLLKKVKSKVDKIQES